MYFGSPPLAFFPVRRASHCGGKGLARAAQDRKAPPEMAIAPAFLLQCKIFAMLSGNHC